MESDNGMDISRSSGGPVGSRWTPTKEQIDLLEDLYRQGVRTPSAGQIQQMTSKLRAFGHIEGKNVFYWFQNHKARQRQKQKQENVALLNRLMLHRTPPPHFATYYRNVSCHPSIYMPSPPSPPTPSELGYHPNYTKLHIPGCYKKRSLQPGTLNNTLLYTKPCKVPVQEPMLFQEQNLSMQIKGSEKGFYNSNEEPLNHQETLNLFPLHPNGNLHARRDSISTPTCNYNTAIDINYNNGGGTFGHDQPIIDFFRMDGQCKSS